MYLYRILEAGERDLLLVHLLSSSLHCGQLLEVRGHDRLKVYFLYCISTKHPASGPKGTTLHMRDAITIHLARPLHLLQPCSAHLHCKGGIDLLVVSSQTQLWRDKDHF